MDMITARNTENLFVEIRMAIHLEIFCYRAHQTQYLPQLTQPTSLITENGIILRLVNIPNLLIGPFGFTANCIIPFTSLGGTLPSS